MNYKEKQKKVAEYVSKVLNSFDITYNELNMETGIYYPTCVSIIKKQNDSINCVALLLIAEFLNNKFKGPKPDFLTSIYGLINKDKTSSWI